MSSLPVKRTYGSRNRQCTKNIVLPPSPPSSTLSLSPPASPKVDRPSKRSLSDLSSENSEPLFPPLKKHKSLPTSKPKQKGSAKTKGNFKKPSQKTLTQLHFNIDQSILRTCSLCDLSYTKGAPDDEVLHRAHCLRVRQGMEWGREEEKDRMRNGNSVITEIRTEVKLKSGKKKGRIICLPADVGGKVGAKLTTLLQTINLSLSAPDLPSSLLQSSKAYLFLLPHETQANRERIVGCVLAQRITTALAVIPSAPSPTSSKSDPAREQPSKETSEAEKPIVVDIITNLCCSSTPLPTPMGISRLFVSSSHRRMGIAQLLLDAAASKFVYGCSLDPRRGEVAFSQPTTMGQAVMKSWGSSRVYEE
ncbi:ESCO1/2 acetyl-transferase-domain-containing protein [Crepidotus variabilis]|uniref:ESCO1/2 acetyl-transferase-domain-containing protein n=1 Tax=Crepidotus variabilis TaxID=179855 RepID=A0A9P6E545_9AGAR|nr:ESCO1/2 acetyl-transferase-domain-containing protein [Crepidotus variabilis]